MDKTYRYSVYELTIKYITKESVMRESFHMTSFETAKKFANELKKKDHTITIQRIKEIKVYDFVNK